MKNRLASHIFVYFLVALFFVSLLTAVTQMIVQHRKMVDSMQSRVDYIRNSYVDIVSLSLYTLDEEYLAICLNSLLNVEYVRRVAIIEKGEKGGRRYEIGAAAVKGEAAEVFTLEYHIPGKGDVTFGELEIVFDREKIVREIFWSGLSSFLTIMVLILLSFLGLFYLFHRKITARLSRLTTYSDKAGLDTTASPDFLNGRTGESSAMDEIDQLAHSLNDMRIRLSQDVILLKEREKELTSKTRDLQIYEQIISASEDLMSFIDTDYRYRAVNRSYETHYCTTRESIIGKSIPELLGAENFETKVKKNLDNALAGENVHFTEWFTYIDGASRFMDIKYYPVRNSGNDVEGVVACVRDLTGFKEAENERDRLREQLFHGQKMESIGTLAGGIAHDFNNILSSIIGFAELALEDVDADTLMADHLNEVYTAARRARDLVAQILVFARQPQDQLGPVQVGAIVREVLKFIRSSLPASIEIKSEISGESLIMGNQTQIHQILMNLCTNAASAMGEHGGLLLVRLSDAQVNEELAVKVGLESGNYVELAVSDEGAGIAPEIEDKIFEPYYTTKGPEEGTGMGLALVHGIVESHGGKITVDSVVGVGSTFTVYLPVVDGVHALVEKKSSNHPGGQEHIMIVDDEPPVAKIGGLALERLGYRVTTVTKSEDALEIFSRNPDGFDMVVTDMTMPGMNGITLATQLTKLRGDIPVILCTGYNRKIEDSTLAGAGIRALVNKPVLRDDLARIVRAVLDEAN